MEIHKKETICETLKRFAPGYYNYYDSIEVTEWDNGEGIDIDIMDEKHISLTYAELDAINYLCKTLQYPEIIDELEKPITYKDLIN